MSEIVGRPRKNLHESDLEGRWLLVSHTDNPQEADDLVADRDRLQKAEYECYLIRKPGKYKLYRRIDKRDLIQGEMNPQAFADWIKYLMAATTDKYPRA